MHDEDEGKYLVRGKGKKVKVPSFPECLLEVPQGGVVFIPVRVGAHFAGPGGGEFTDTLCRLYHLESKSELYKCNDIYIAHSNLVGAYRLEE